MSERYVPIDQVHLTELIRNPIIVRIVSILDLASLSILELLEYNLEGREINYALSEGVIAIDKTGLHSTGIVNEQEGANMLLSGDTYFYNFLNSKVKLTELGLYILDSVKGVAVKFEMPVDYANQSDLTPFNTPSIP
jgi:hypothetical protein